jgi:hypothetical protein
MRLDQKQYKTLFAMKINDASILAFMCIRCFVLTRPGDAEPATTRDGARGAKIFKLLSQPLINVMTL